VSAATKIEWTRGDDGSAGATWNPVTGCTKVSEGCDHCYAETFAERWRGIPGHPFEQGFDVRLWPERLGLPLQRRKPTRYFVNSMSDLLHDAVDAAFVARVVAVVALARRHTFQVLTKRAGRLQSLLASDGFWNLVRDALADYGPPPADAEAAVDARFLPNLWLGVSVESPKWAAVRLDKLTATTAGAVRFASCEPLLGELDLRPWLGSGLDWVIAGGESGPRSRPVHPAWIRSLRDQCQASGVPYFFKLLCTNSRIGGRGATQACCASPSSLGRGTGQLLSSRPRQMSRTRGACLGGPGSDPPRRPVGSAAACPVNGSYGSAGHCYQEAELTDTAPIAECIVDERCRLDDDVSPHVHSNVRLYSYALNVRIRSQAESSRRRLRRSRSSFLQVLEDVEVSGDAVLPLDALLAGQSLDVDHGGASLLPPWPGLAPAGSFT
jgi:protein gp37